MKKFLKFWLPVIVWAVVIYSFSSIKTPSTSEIFWQDFMVKKTAHVVEYGILAVLLYRAFRSQGLNKTRAGTMAIILAAGYGGTDEFHQSFTAGREPTVRDVVFDTIGATLGIYIIWKLLPNLPPRLKTLAKSLDLL
ncbi:MAG: VanZ family protein [Patescibacteria group bacterium]